MTKEVDRRAWFDELVVWHVRADLNVPGPLLDKQAAALLLDKTRRRSSRLAGPSAMVWKMVAPARALS